MKKIIIPLLGLFLLTTPAYALETGWYTIQSTDNITYRLDTNTKLARANNQVNQKFYIVKQSDNTYKIATGNSVGVRVISSKGQNETWSGTDAQKWTIVGDTIKNKSTGKLIGGLTKKWRFVPFSDKVTVVFRDENGKVLKRKAVTKGGSVTAPSVPKKEGYSALWDKPLNNITTHTTVRLSYKPNKCSIVFNANGGTGNMNNLTADYDTMQTLTTNAFTKTGYTFKGWNTKADGTGTGYINNARIRAKNITLYAQWTPASYSVYFSGNGGTGSMGSITKPYNTTFTLPKNTFVRTNYTFKNWNTKSDGSGTSYTDSFKMPAAYTMLYAQWKPKTYNVTFNGNGNTGGSTASLVNKDYNSKQTLPANGFTKTGYTFTGWNTRADGKGTSYANKSAYTIPAGSTTLYAQWKVNTYTVKFVNNGSIIKTVNVQHGNGVNAPSRLYRTGYAFSGWDKPLNNVTGNLTVNAKWTARNGKVVMTEIGKPVFTYLTGEQKAIYDWLMTQINNSKSAKYPKEVDYADANAAINAVNKYYFRYLNSPFTSLSRTSSGKYTLQIDGAESKKSKDKNSYIRTKVISIANTIIRKGMSEKDAATALNTWVKKNWKYQNYYNLYDALTHNGGACAAYSQLAQAVFDYVGMDCKLASGKANGGSHAWNRIEINGKWYYYDYTWSNNYQYSSGLWSDHTQTELKYYFD